MPPTSRSQRKPRPKVSKACDRCRILKVRCSGTNPCSRCDRRNEACHFAAEEKRISVRESYLRELQQGRNALATPPNSTIDASTIVRDETLYRRPSTVRHPVDPALSETGTPRETRHGIAGGPSISDPVTSSPAGNAEPGFGQNPLANENYSFASAGGRSWYMAPTSSWSFCRRVLALLGKRIPEVDSDPWNRPDKSAYQLQWTPLSPNDQPDVSNLPHRDHALFLIGAAKFYLNNYLGMIEEPQFTKNVYELYENPAEKANSSRTWYAHFLLVLAYGKAYSIGNSNSSPPGSFYAQRAMTMLPDMSGLYPDPILAIQTMTLAAMYFQSLDMRTAAYYHISQALRTGVLEGMHRHIPEQIVGAEHSKRCNLAFWVIYTMEKEFSSAIGAPCALQDEAITAKPPSQMNDSVDAVNMELHVRLSRLTARILSTVYGVGSRFDNTLIPNTQSILRDLARLSMDLTDLLRTQFPGPFSKASRMAHRLIISYHHCVVLSTRPLVMCALQMHVENTDTEPAKVITLTSTVASLLYSCVDSAQTILKMLRALDEEGLLDSFLPFQIDAAYSSAFILHLIRLISPSLFQDQSWSNDIEYILDKMIAAGSVLAPIRKMELIQLENVMAALTTSPDQSWGLAPGASYIHEQSFDGQATEDIFGDPFWNAFSTNGISGLLPQEMLDLADRLDVEETSAGD